VRTFRLTLAYDGTEFHGWQVQPGIRTVQGILEDALSKLPLDELTRVVGAGRTDAGVHARGQVASFSAETRLPVRAFAPRLNRQLPDDVRVLEAAEAEPAFHARHSARARRYRYRLMRHDDLLARRYAWCPPRPFDADALERAVRTLEGEHDFASFQAAGAPPTRTVCHMLRAGWRSWDGGLELDVIADHFLYHMVRNIVGTALAAARAADPAAAMRRVLGTLDRRAAGITAPPHALSLEQVFYETAVAA
jgi:tRNA pseudouridine38-40 synthase